MIAPKFGSLQLMNTVIGTDIAYAAGLLTKGELVAIPTETVYGLAGNALNEESVIRIFEAKRRPRFNPLIIHLPSLDAAVPYVTHIPAPIRALAEKYSPGPLSYLLPRTSRIPDLVTAGSERVVVRIPSHPMTLELLRQLPFPLAAPSANPFGYVSPVTAQHVKEGLEGRIPYILDGGVSSVGLESTIVGMEGDEIVVHRLGGISAEEIKAVTGKEPLLSLLHQKPDTPGQLKAHYAPGKQLLIGDVPKLMKQWQTRRIGVISFHTQYPEAKICKVLSASADLHEAASHLFASLRELDNTDVDIILAEQFPDHGIGMAINDRLGRASSG
jgi:L-threonylcarbamoyladenylate synthase